MDEIDTSEFANQAESLGGSLSEMDLARGGIVAARGTVDGLVIRVDGRLDAGTMRQALDEFVSARSSFLSGQEIFLEWVGMRPSLEIESSLTQLLTKSYGIAVKAVRLYSRPPSADGFTNVPLRAGSHHSIGGASISGATGASAGEGGLFEGVRSIGSGDFDSDSAAIHGVGLSGAVSSGSTTSFRGAGEGLRPQIAGADSFSTARTFQSPLSGHTLPWDEPDTRLIHATLRSGQKIESEHSLVIVGDVNSGAEVVSGGDIVILGTLRGVAHAGAYEESGGGRVILALNMQPTQLRIGAVISRGGASDSRPDGRVSDSRSSDGKLFVEIARVDGATIIVEPYQTKTLGKGAAARVGALASTVGLLGRKRGAA